MKIRYTTLDPTGNITCLVLDPVPPEDRSRVTQALMPRCEQVGYLLPPQMPGAHARLEMMGGEFCANASMAAAAYLCSREGHTEDETALEVSGTSGLVPCRVRTLPDGRYEGTVEIPSDMHCFDVDLGGLRCPAVRMEGIVHLILKDQDLKDTEAEALIQRAADILPDPAVGLLHWDSAHRMMHPLVYVKAAGTLVWETGCGSGSTALGVYLAREKGDGICQTEILQPGGIIRAETEIRDGKLLSVSITGRVRLGKTDTIDI